MSLGNQKNDGAYPAQEATSILPCSPPCGGKAVVTGDPHGDRAVECTRCRLQMFDTCAEGAVASWNRRMSGSVGDQAERKSVVRHEDLLARIRLPLSHESIRKLGDVVADVLRDRDSSREVIIGEEGGWLEFSSADRANEEDAKWRMHVTGEN